MSDEWNFRNITKQNGKKVGEKVFLAIEKVPGTILLWLLNFSLHKIGLIVPDPFLPANVIRNSL